ncbi:MAG TPA: hypothetical protein VFQ88_11050 [Nevskiaceae bacterium]|nr:hypothetical protein [Nevskiaceae bacterium]
MAKIIPFPLRKAVRGEVFCREANVVFPRVYRVTVSTTVEHMLAVRIDAKEAARIGVPWGPSTNRFYTLDPSGSTATRQIGDTTVTPITALEEGVDTESILVRHHRSKEEAFAFMDGCMMEQWYATGFGRSHEDSPAGPSQDPEWAEVCGELFTLAPVRAVFGQSRPRLMYECRYWVPADANPLRGGYDEVWIRAMGDDGRLMDLWGNE